MRSMMAKAAPLVGMILFGPANAQVLRVRPRAANPSGEPTASGPLTLTLTLSPNWGRGVFFLSCLDLEKGCRSPSSRSRRTVSRRGKHFSWLRSGAVRRAVPY